MPPRLRAMLADLRDIKRELLPAPGEKAEDQLNLDDYGKKMLDLTKLLQEVRTEVDRLNELRAAAPDGRDVNTIRIANDNLKNLKKASDIWKEAKQVLLRDAARKKIDEKTVDDRKRKLTLVFDEIKELSNKNSSVRIEKTAIEKDIDAKKAERERRRKEAKAKAKSRRRAKRDGTDGDGGDDGDDKDAADADDIEMRPVQQATAQEQAFFEEVAKNKEEQDKMLDDILKGVTELGDIANAIKTQIDIGSAMADELETKLDKTIATFKTSNAKLQELLDESGGMSRWCPVLICLIILLACGGYLYSQR